MLTRNAEFLAYAAFMTACQLAAALRLRRLLDEPAAPPFRPRATVIVPCKGAPPHLAAGVEAMLRQTLKDAEFLFVVPSGSDPAAGPIRAAIAGDARARLLVSDAVPSRCSGKIVDLLHAVEKVRADSEVLAFADADLAVRPDWLESLVAPLARQDVGVATSCALYVADEPGFWAFMRMVWMGALVPYLASLGWVAGQSFALRRADFFSFGIPRLWERSLLEDLPVGQAARRAGKRVRFVGGALSSSRGPCGLESYLSQFNKWAVLLRAYDPKIWLCACAAVFMHGWIVYWCARPPAALWVPAALLAGDAAVLALVFSILSRRAGDIFAGLQARYRPLPLWAAAAAPLLWLTYAVNLWHSLLHSHVAWGGRLYRLRGPQDVEVVG